MIKNYLTIAFRNLWKNKGISAINILGLSVGLACFSLFALYYLHENHYDRFHPDADRLYLVHYYSGPINGQDARKAEHLPSPLGPALQADLPDVAAFTRLRDVSESYVRNHQGVKRETLTFADPAFFEMFDFPVKYGPAHGLLSDPNQLVLTRKMSEKLFGEANATGKILEVKLDDSFQPFTVAAVLEDIPGNSSINFGILLPFDAFLSTKHGAAGATRWHRFAIRTLVKLREGSGLPQDTARMAQFFLKYYPDDEKELRASGRWSRPERPLAFGFTPLMAWHRDPDFGAPSRLSLILLGVGTIILLIACINFTTLAIGRSAGRAREIGVRKVIGATRVQLSRQFLAEALLLSGVSTGLGVILAQVLLPQMNLLTDKRMAFDVRLFPELYWFFPALALGAGCLAGVYPALVLSGFSPLQTLKSKLRIGGENWFTRSLVSFQFVLSIGLIACTFVMLRQLNYLQGKNPGFEKENVVVLNAEGVKSPKTVLARFREQLGQSPEILGVSGAELLLGAEAGWSMSGFSFEGQDKNIYEYYVDEQYLGVLGLQLLQGRNFHPGIASDSLTSVILNESAVRDFGWTPETAVGQVLKGYDERHPEKNPVVIGVVKDYNFMSLHQAVKPMMFTHFAGYDPLQYFVRIAPGYPKAALEKIQRAWSAVEPVFPMQYVFLDENIQRFYEPEAKLGRTIAWASGIAIVLACLGLLGLSALATLNRTREIGVRKVLGASVTSITRLLARDFMRLVLIAFVLATPLAYYGMREWLSEYAYRIELSWWIFLLAGMFAVLIALATVGYNGIKAALANPVKSLRND